LFIVKHTALANLTVTCLLTIIIIILEMFYVSGPICRHNTTNRRPGDVCCH